MPGAEIPFILLVGMIATWRTRTLMQEAAKWRAAPEPLRDDRRLYSEVFGFCVWAVVVFVALLVTFR